MEIEQIFNNIKFKLNPEEDYRKAYLFRLKKGLFKLINLDRKFLFDNCIIKKEFENIKLKNILLKIDSMSTYAIGHIVNQICRKLSDDQIYLNIGCWKGFTLVSGMIDTNCKVIGVDNFARYGVIERDRNYTFVQGDLTDPIFVDEIMEGIDGVVQAAALIYGVGGFHKYPADILAKDVVLHQNILCLHMLYLSKVLKLLRQKVLRKY